jgi:hypothetical protein
MPMMNVATRISLAMAIGCLGTSCLHNTPPPGPPGASASQPAARASSEQPLVIRTTLSYTRPRLFESANRPTTFGLLRDYHTATAADIVELYGAWNDATQTLTTDVTISVGSENLVFVDDPALGPGSETPIRAGRAGVLHEIACPETVPQPHPCYLLQLLR